MPKSLSTCRRIFLYFSPVILIVFLCAACTSLGVQADQEKEASGPSVWVRTGGPSGGYINDIAICAGNPVPATNGNNVTRCLALSADGSILYFGSFKSGVFRRRISF